MGALAVLAGCAGLAAVTAAQPAPCEDAGLRMQLLTPSAGRVPRGGGLVLGLEPGGPPGAAPTVESLTLKRGRRRGNALRAEPLAPGLYRLTPEGRVYGGRYQVDGLEAAGDVIFDRSRMPPPPPAPRLEEVHRYLRTSLVDTRLEVRGSFAFPIPERVVAIVSYWGEDDEADGFVRAVPTARDALIFTSRVGCGSSLAGATAPPEEGQARVAFVDAFGQVSPPSEPRPID